MEHNLTQTRGNQMTREGISFEIRAGLGRNEWTMVIAYPDRAEPSVSQATGSRDDAIAAARSRIGRWYRRQRKKVIDNASR